MRWWLKIRKRQTLDRDLQEEIAFHRAMRARDAAYSETLAPPFGNETQIREEIRDMWTFVSIESVWRDVCFALRGLRRNPAFTVVAILTLAIGIGANTAIFSVVNGVLIKPLPYPQPNELVAVWHSARFQNVTSDRVNLSSTMYLTYRDQNRTFQQFGVWHKGAASVTGVGEPEEVRTLVVTYGVLPAVGLSPLLGRWFTQTEDTPGTPETAILSYGYWQRRFGGDETAIGRTITVDSRSREVIGVMRKGFRFLDSDPEVILPQRFEGDQLRPNDVYSYTGIARLKPGVTLSQASNDIARMLPIWIEQYGTSPKLLEAARFAPNLRPLKQDVVGDITPLLWVLMGTIGVVLLIACANVANLLLARMDGRQQELAVRTALGAGWGRIARELLVESLLLALMGGAVGLALAFSGLRILLATSPANLPRVSEIAIDPVVLAFTLAVSLLTGLLFGIVPAVKYAGQRISLVLRSGGRALSRSRERHHSQSTLVVVQVALALVLLVASGLMIRTFRALRTVQPGFVHPERIQTVRISIPEAQVQQPELVMRMQNDILSKFAAIPGVTSVAFGTALPMETEFQSSSPITAEDRTPQQGIPPLRRTKVITPDFFKTLGTPLVAGRDFNWTDVYSMRPVVIVSENMARDTWGEPAAALGKRIRIGRVGPWQEIIGVAGDVFDSGVDQKAPSTVYFRAGVLEGVPGIFRTTVNRAVTFAIRSNRAGNESFLQEIHMAVSSSNPNLPLASIRTLQSVYERSLQRTSFTLVMLALSGTMALLLGTIGIYGVISYTVSQRRREIGIRLALGARAGELKRMFVGNALALAGTGVMVGLGAAAGLTRLMKSLLFGISPLDPLTYALVLAVLMAAALLASYLPARRVSRVDPNEALRME